MKKNPISLAVGVLLLLIFGALIFCFQVRSTEMAVVTTFGRFSRAETEPGLKFRLPQPFRPLMMAAVSSTENFRHYRCLNGPVMRIGSERCAPPGREQHASAHLKFSSR